VGRSVFEEPELSLHAGIVSRLAEVIARLQQKKSGIRQVILTTHSHDLLSNPGIGGEEVLVLVPGDEGTVVHNMSSLEDVAQLLQEGIATSGRDECRGYCHQSYCTPRYPATDTAILIMAAQLTLVVEDEIHFQILKENCDQL